MSHSEPRRAARSSVRLVSQLDASPAIASLAAPAAESRPPRLDDGSRIAPPRDRGNVAPDDQRPLYVAVGIIVLAAVFWWNRRQRDRFDLEDDRSDATTTTGRRGDDDADDLHAAARGEAQSPGSKIDKVERRGVGTAPPAGPPEGETTPPVGSFDRTPPESGPKSGQSPAKVRPKSGLR